MLVGITKKVIRWIAATALLIPVPLSAQTVNEVDSFRANLEKWVEAREVLSKERSDWLVDKEYLRSTRDLLTGEKESLRAEISAFEKADQGANEERRRLLIQRGEFQRTAASLEDRLALLEARLLEVVPRLPTPLTKRIEPLLVQIPEDPDRAGIPIGQRLMNLLGVLGQAEKFNRTATLVGETREVGDGQKRQVRTLYWGLGEAIYVDGQGDTAGLARPGPEGWEFVDDPNLARDAKLLLDIFEGNVETISFVPIPVTIR